jgi:thioredoxin 1
MRSGVGLVTDVIEPVNGSAMATLPLTEESFQQTVTQDGIVLVDFWASWCGPCRMFAPVYEKASETHGDITFASIDTEAEQGLSGALRISSIPTLMAFRDGILVFRQAGALPAPALEELITAVRGLDMDDVRRQVAAQEAQH